MKTSLVVEKFLHLPHFHWCSCSSGSVICSVGIDNALELHDSVLILPVSVLYRDWIRFCHDRNHFCRDRSHFCRSRSRFCRLILIRNSGFNRNQCWFCRCIKTHFTWSGGNPFAVDLTRAGVVFVTLGTDLAAAATGVFDEFFLFFILLSLCLASS
jgi:hypothetical protein